MSGLTKSTTSSQRRKHDWVERQWRSPPSGGLVCLLLPCPPSLVLTFNDFQWPASGNCRCFVATPAARGSLAALWLLRRLWFFAAAAASAAFVNFRRLRSFRLATHHPDQPHLRRPVPRELRPGWWVANSFRMRSLLFECLVRSFLSSNSDSVADFHLRIQFQAFGLWAVSGNFAAVLGHSPPPPNQHHRERPSPFSTTGGAVGGPAIHFLRPTDSRQFHFQTTNAPVTA